MHIDVGKKEKPIGKEDGGMHRPMTFPPADFVDL
jgi:hypothetical protein